MAGAGYRNWTAGDIPTATQFDTFLQEQVVQVHATAAARNATLAAVLAEGMVAYLLDTNTITVYTGAAWSTIGPVHGAPSSWTPTVTQSGSVTVTNTGSTYTRVGRRIFADLLLVVTGSGTASTVITVSVPVEAAFTDSRNLPVGVGKMVDVSASDFFVGQWELNTATTMRLRLDVVSGAADMTVGDDTFTAGLAVGDLIEGTISYVAAADA